jgi:EPS-associated MarR family transcriptional regulator
MHLKTQHRDDTHFRVLRHLEENPHLSQRELADALGVSLGKVNYLLNALVEKGLVKIGAFRRSGDKLNKIAYLLTPAGLRNRAALTRSYLDRKTREYEALKAELKELHAEIESHAATEPRVAARNRRRG